MTGDEPDGWAGLNQGAPKANGKPSENAQAGRGCLFLLAIVAGLWIIGTIVSGFRGDSGDSTPAHTKAANLHACATMERIGDDVDTYTPDQLQEAVRNAYTKARGDDASPEIVAALHDEAAAVTANDPDALNAAVSDMNAACTSVPMP